MSQSERVYNRFIIESAIDRAWPRGRVASTTRISREEVSALVRATMLREGTMLVEANVMGRVKDLLKLFDKVPNLWQKLKDSLDLPDDFNDMNFMSKGKVLFDKVKALLAEGKRTLGNVFAKLKETFPVSLFFVPSQKMPGLTDLLQMLAEEVPWLKKKLDQAGKFLKSIDDVMNKYLPTLKKPLLAAIFIYVWFNVAELTWDIPSIVRGFLGQISLGELFGSFPESIIGFLVGLALPGMGTFGALPITLIARLAWLVANHFLEWVPGKGLKVHWEKLGIEPVGPDVVPV